MTTLAVVRTILTSVFVLIKMKIKVTARFQTASVTKVVIVVRRKKTRKSNITYSEDEDDEHVTTDENTDWEDVTEDDDIPPRIQFNIFSKTPGPQVPTHIKEPLEFFELFFTDELINSIINMTNIYAKQKIKAFEPLTKDSIWKT